MVPLELASVGIVQGSSEVVMILRAPHTGQLLVMAIGPFEGQAIARGVEHLEMPRPMTHDLMVTALQQLGAKVQKVLIRDVQDKTFFATLFIQNGEGDIIEVDSRPSDAVACAVRSGAPIFADPVVMALASIRPDDESEDDEDEEGEVEAEADDEDGPVH